MNQIFIEQRKWFFVIVFVAIIFGAIPVFASPPAPTPVCQISGVIKSVEFKDAYDEACIKEHYRCQTDMELRHPARYFFDVSINSVSYVSGDTSFLACQNMYSVGKVQKIYINKDKVKSGDTFSVNQKIGGIARSFWGISFDSYTLAVNERGADIDTSGQASSCVDLSNNLRYRMRDSSVNNEVSDLQDFLNSKGFLRSEPTGFFGLATLKAVKAYQSSVGLSPTGFVGHLTRANIRTITCSATE